MSLTGWLFATLALLSWIAVFYLLSRKGPLE